MNTCYILINEFEFGKVYLSRGKKYCHPDFLKDALILIEFYSSMPRLPKGHLQGQVLGS